jgi:hypothetical protein
LAKSINKKPVSHISNSSNENELKEKWICSFTQLTTTSSRRMGGMELKLHAFVISAPDGSGELHAPSVFPTTKYPPIPIGYDAVGKKRIPCPCRESNPGRPARRLVTILTELSRLPTNHKAACCMLSRYGNRCSSSVSDVYKDCLLILA